MNFVRVTIYIEVKMRTRKCETRHFLDFYF